MGSICGPANEANFEEEVERIVDIWGVGLIRPCSPTCSQEDHLTRGWKDCLCERSQIRNDASFCEIRV